MLSGSLRIGESLTMHPHLRNEGCWCWSILYISSHYPRSGIINNKLYSG